MFGADISESYIAEEPNKIIEAMMAAQDFPKIARLTLYNSLKASITPTLGIGKY